nr:RHS repeat protein [Desulfobacula sp.]
MNYIRCLDHIQVTGSALLFSYDTGEFRIGKASTHATHAYDAADRLISTTDIDGHVTTYEYDAGGNLIRTTDPNGHITRYEYDAMNRRTAVIDANGNRTQSVYDLGGRLVKIIDANGHAVRFEYDALGRRTREITPLGFETLYQYDPNGNLIRTIDANAAAGLQPKNSRNATVYNEYDAFNRVIRTLDALNGETRYTYDLLGNMTSITDAKGQTTRFVYDGLGRLKEVIDPIHETPADKTVTFTYDQAGNVLTKTDRLGRITQYTRDRLNRLTHVAFLTDNAFESFTYDSYGDLTGAANDEVTYTFAYDEQHRLTSKTDSRLNRSLTWTYDAAGNVIRKTDYQNEITEYQYDSANRLTAERNKGYLQVSYHYDPAGRLLDRILSNRAKTSYKYDNSNRLTELKNTSAEDKYSHTVTYTHDNTGNILTATDDTGTVTYAYDALYRLTSADYPVPADDQSYTYDTVGNRKTMANASGTRHYLYNNPGNRLDEVRDGSDTGPVVYRYIHDAAGNRIEKRGGSDAVLQSYTYDQKNRITTLADESGTHTFAYDPNDYRIEKAGPDQTRKYLMEGEHYEAVYDGGNALTARYLRGVVVDEIIYGYLTDQGEEKGRTFHHDHLNSVTALTGHNGDEVETTTYGPFGEVISSSGTSPNTLKYTGRGV